MTPKKLRNLGLTQADIPTGFCRKSTFSKNFDDVMERKAHAAINAITNAVHLLMEEGTLPKGSRAIMSVILAGGKKSYMFVYSELENCKYCPVLQVDISSGTLDNPNGKITATTYWGAFSDAFVTDTLDNVELVKGKIVQKLKDYRAEHSDDVRPAGQQAVSMAFAEGITRMLI